MGTVFVPINITQWTPLKRLTLGPTTSEFYNRMNLIGEVIKRSVQRNSKKRRAIDWNGEPELRTGWLRVEIESYIKYSNGYLYHIDATTYDLAGLNALSLLRAYI
jgi:hypothetical protein